MKYSFKNDYSEGCHRKILIALSEHNFTKQNGYSDDEYCIQAENKIKSLCESPSSKVHFVAGGTLANLLVISSLLKGYESVISANTGHINNNETGAIENTGHRVHSVNSNNGKISPELILPILDEHSNAPHQVKPKLVYISNSTEVGSIYSTDELRKLSAFCKENELYLFMDGARLGHALMADKNDLTLKDIAKLTDVFYIGGTKNGALFGEAIVINNENILQDFRFYMKQKGALLAKGRALGIQFDTLFTDDLYFELAAHANQQAMKIKEAFAGIGCNFLSDTFTNQLFPILNNNQIELLQEYYDFYVWKKIDSECSAIRIITSWATEHNNVEAFCNSIKKLNLIG